MAIRLLRLMPDRDDHSPIRCQLLEYSIRGDGKGTHPYEALSYVWGSQEKLRIALIGGAYMRITDNLHAALSRLRNPFLERILWIDAICINQDSEEERNRQVRIMPEIYARASRVLVWLEESTDGRQLSEDAADGDQALKEIGIAATLKSSSSDANQEAVCKLLKRTWFRRIWVLQEVAAARHIVVVSRSAEIDGHAFCAGLKELNLTSRNLDPQNQVGSAVYLMQDAVLRPKFAVGSSDRFSLQIRPLGELIDMYHNREATKLQDKVYALLGMSSDDSIPAGWPDYSLSWEHLFCRLVRFLVGERASVRTWAETEIAVIKSNIRILGRISSIRSEGAWGDRQQVKVVLKNVSGAFTQERGPWILQASAKSTQKGDVVCLLQGASKPTIIRPCNGYSAIIMIAVPLAEWAEASSTEFPHDVVLVWDWNASQSSSHNGEDYERLISTLEKPECSRCECQNDLDRVLRLWAFGLLLNGAERYEEAGETLSKAVRFYETARKKLHGPREKGSEEALKVMDDLVIEDENGRGTVIKAMGGYGPTPLMWAVEEGHETFLRLLLDKGANIEGRDERSRTPLARATGKGHEKFVRLLLDEGANVRARDNNRLTPLAWAAGNGQEAVVRLLLDKGVNIEREVESVAGSTPLVQAARGGHEVVVQLLLDRGATMETDNTVTSLALAEAARYGHEAVVRLLVDNGADIKASAGHSRNPLALAAEGGHETVVQLLLDKGANIDIGKGESPFGTPLTEAARRGHEVVAELLLGKGADIEAKSKFGQTPLAHAAIEGHGAVVQLLLDNNANIEAVNTMGSTPLAHAAGGGHGAVVQLLLDNNANIEAVNTIGLTPLAHAASEGHGAVVQLLLDKGADIEGKGEHGQTPLAKAAQNGQKKVVQLLLDKGANIEAKDKDGRTPLVWATERGHEAIVRLLLGNDANIEEAVGE